ncbi:MAG: ATP-binding cassette domain-containing protein [Zoogloea sp.]|nr:ATP-binding cassette domain-containing protein [Zoogloea sp.]
MTSPSKSASRLVYRVIFSAVMRYRRRTLAALGLVVLAKLATVAVPLALKSIVDQLGGPAPAVLLPVFVLLGYALLRFLGTFFSEIRDIVFARVTQNTVSGFLLDAFRHLHRLSVRFHAMRRTGGVTRDVERGTAGIAFLLGVALFTVLPTLVEIVSVIVIMSIGYSNWFTVIIMATFLAYTAFTISYTERRAIYQRALNELDSSANSRLVDSLLNYEAVKSYANEEFEQARFAGILDKWIEVGVQNQKALSLLHIVQSGVIAVGVASVMLLAGENVVRREMTVGDLVLINAYVIQVCMPLNSLGFIFRQARDAIVNAELMFRLMAQKPEIEDQPGQPDLVVERGEVRFEHVDFSYEPSRQILWDVSFSIPPGGKVAVVGGSGSGKSTLSRLLFRYYDVGAGAISIDGQDIRNVNQRSLRSAIGIVPQDTVLFNDTIAYNIGYGRTDAGLAEVIEAAKAAHVHEFIASLPEQYDTVVGERGVKLSGGEKQRVAIARAILKNPPVLVFDEATSALDTRSERAIQEELDRLAREHTTLVIAHRLSTVVDADEILVLEHGRIVERGTHHQLLRLNGLYAQMWSLQRQQQELEQAEQGLAMQPVNLIALAAGVVDGLKPVIDAGGVSFYSTITAESANIVGDPSSLQLALWTLCRQAIEHSGQGGRVELRIERSADRVRLTVADSGSVNGRPVLSAQDEKRRVSDLVSVRTVVEQHGGSLETTGGHHNGSSGVVAEFPLRVVLEAIGNDVFAQLPAAPKPLLRSPSIGGVSVLLVDDDDVSRTKLEAILHGNGALSRTYPSGAAAVEWLRSLPRPYWPGVIVCDIALGHEDGYEVIQQLRQLEAKLELGLAERLPAIALGSRDSAESRTRALLAGFQVYLTKPVAADELVAAIASLAVAER